MDFTLNTILGEDVDQSLLARSCFFLSRGNHKRLSLGWSFPTHRRTTSAGSSSAQKGGETAKETTCVVSFQKRTSKKRGNKVLGSGILSFTDQHPDYCKDYDGGDDDTASTVDMYEDEFQVAASTSSKRSVRFETEPVTAVYTRPRTTKDDKYYLHYDEYDYMDFKLEYRDDLLKQRRQQQSCSRHNDKRNTSSSCLYRRSPRKVSFKREVVESVHPVMDRNQRKEIQNDLFYTEEEMRAFLDEFVVSLQQQQQQQQVLA
eukprot:CAMPEP_0168191722 /NCGR_PEP_ID=MMETSP0139_2-20121125/17670_1 /TAXON_ID=44445 /ORGANISM="Pseudo-nitzschia australis, Strain 10249 10 AB" /LENGTH=259 /DNA_ID=CAMNT_0008114921 /DNA_START=284 /DNA_END=1063 /DNA_ORIENTATION=-